MPGLLSPAVVTVNGVSAAALKIVQGCDPPKPVTNQSPQFASSDQLDAVFVTGPSPVFVSVLQPTGDVSQIRWQLDRDPSEGNSTPPPALSNSTGPKVSFVATASGNFRLIAYVDLNGNQTFDGGEQLFVMCFAIVGVTVQGTENFRSGMLVLRTWLLDVPAPGMSLDATYLLEGGGSDRTIGASKIAIGNVGNVMADTFQVNYPPTPGNSTPGTAFNQPGGALPMLDTSGNGPFRGNSTSTVTGAPPPGVTVGVSSRDNPQFIWADPHPATGNPARTVSGGFGFREFVVAFSQFFPSTFVTLFQADWTASPCPSGRAKVSPATPATPRGAVTRPPSFLTNNKMIYSPQPKPGTGAAGSGTCPGTGVPPPTKDLADFALGQVVGEALESGCGVVLGELVTGTPRPGEPVKVRVSRAIRGGYARGEIITIPYAARGTSPTSGDALAHAWDHVRFEPRTRVMALLAERAMQERRAAAPVLVTSRPEEFQAIMALIQMADSLNASPEKVDQAVTSAITEPDPLAGGFLYAHLWHQSMHDPQHALRLFSRMIGWPDVPRAAWGEMAEDMALFYSLVSAECQKNAFRRFVELAQSPDVEANMAGFRGMGKIAQFTKLPALSADSGAKLAKSYRRLLEVEGMRCEPALETALSIE